MRAAVVAVISLAVQRTRWTAHARKADIKLLPRRTTGMGRQWQFNWLISEQTEGPDSPFIAWYPFA
jgi:hypothetical protein